MFSNSEKIMKTVLKMRYFSLYLCFVFTILSKFYYYRKKTIQKSAGQPYNHRF